MMKRDGYREAPIDSKGEGGRVRVGSTLVRQVVAYNIWGEGVASGYVVVIPHNNNKRTRSLMTYGNCEYIW